MSDPIRAQLADGTTLEFPAGTSMEVIQGVVKRMMAGNSGPKEDVVAQLEGGRIVRMSNGALAFASPGYSTSDPATVNRIMEGATIKEVVQSGFDEQILRDYPAAARLGEFARGAPFVGSYTDEIAGKLFGEQAGAGVQVAHDAMRRRRPGQSIGLNLAGAVAGSAPLGLLGAGAAGTGVGAKLVGALPKSTAGRVVAGGLAGAGAGAGEGAVYGYGEGNTAAERTANAGSQATVGGLFGMLAGGAAPIAGDVLSGVIQRWKSRDIDAIAKEFGVSKDAAKVLKRAFQSNDQAAVDRILRAGSEATLADAGRSGKALLDAAAATGGKPLNIVDAAVTARGARSAGTVTDALDDVLGPVRGPREAHRAISQASLPQRKAAYDAAYGTPIDYSAGGTIAAQGQGGGAEVLRVVGGMDEKTVKQAADIANARIKWRVSQGELPPEFGRQILVEAGPDGSLRFVGEMPNVAQLDELKKALNQMDQASRTPWGGSADGGLLADQARAVRDATVAATGGPEGTYARALKVGGDKVELDKALELGRAMMRDGDNTSVEVVTEAIGRMSDDAKAMARTGLRAHIADVMGRTKIIASAPDSTEAREAMAALKVLSSPNAKAKMKALLGPGEFAKLSGQLDEAISSQGMVAAVAENSRTAVRQSIQGEVNDIVEPGILGKLARGEPVDATKRLTQELLDATPAADAARKEQIWSEIAQVLSQRRGSKSAAAALKYIEKAMSGQPLKEAEARLIASQTVLALPVASGRGANLKLQAPTGGYQR